MIKNCYAPAYKMLVICLLLTSSCGPKTTEADPPADAAAIATDKPRTIVTTDGEIDDVDSFIRMLLYANEFHLEGLVYSSSMWHYKGDGNGTPFTSEMDMTKQLYGERTDLRWPGVQWMQELMDEYEKVFPNLSQHAEGFPTPDYLRSLIKVGNIDFEGEMEQDTEGSDWIKAKLLEDDHATPLYIQAWGGTNTLARALKSIQDTHQNTPEWEELYKRICDNTVLYAILDQDATYRKYIAVHWPDMKIFYNSNQFWCFAYPWKQAVPEPWHTYLEGTFMGPHIIKNHGPLLEKYYSYGDGQHQAGDPEHTHGDLTKANPNQWGSFGQYDFISEGDSPAYFHLIDVGLDNLEHPEYGGWGGRLVQSEEQPNRWEDGESVADFNAFTNTVDKTWPQTRWVKALQQDFAARADWCVKPPAEANHPPVVSLAHPATLAAAPGSKVELKGSATDPDPDQTLSYQWWQYEDVDRYAGKISLQNANAAEASFTVPADFAPGNNIHLILEVTDSGEHPMTRYKRVIVTHPQ